MNFIVVNDLIALNADHIIRVDYYPPDSEAGKDFVRVNVFLTEHEDSLEYIGEDAEKFWQKIASLSK